MNKVYVDVVAEFSKEGCLIPILFVWEDGRKYKIVFCQVLFPEKSVEIPCFRQGIFPTFGGH